MLFLTANRLSIANASKHVITEHSDAEEVDEVGKYHQLAVELIRSGGEGHDEEGRSEHHVSSPRPLLSSQAANIIVSILEKIYNPVSGADNVSLFMSAVHKFAFGLAQMEDSGTRVCDQLCDLTVPVSDDKVQVITRLAQLPVSEW